MYLHGTKVHCYDKAIECPYDNGEKIIMQGKKKLTLFGIITVMKHKHSCKKGFIMFAVHISSDKGKDVEDAKIFKRYHVLQQF